VRDVTTRQTGKIVHVFTFDVVAIRFGRRAALAVHVDNVERAVSRAKAQARRRS
jgi:hypothetical protein